jgi:choline kinase
MGGGVKCHARQKSPISIAEEPGRALRQVWMVLKIKSVMRLEPRTVQLVVHYNEHYVRRKLRESEDENVIDDNNKNKKTNFVQTWVTRNSNMNRKLIL